MTETPDSGLRRRLDAFRHRRASMAADRAAFETRRRHGLTARHDAKLAHLRTRVPTDPGRQEEPTTEHDDGQAA
jgi:hypothetical protein